MNEMPGLAADPIWVALERTKTNLQQVKKAAADIQAQRDLVYNAANDLLNELTAKGTIDTGHSTVSALLDVFNEVDGGVYTEQEIKTGIFVIVADNDQPAGSPSRIDPGGPLIFEQYTATADFKSITERAATLSKRYGRCQIARVVMPNDFTGARHAETFLEKKGW